MMKFLIQKIDGQVRHDFSFTLLESIRFCNWLQNPEKIKYRFFDTTEDAIDFKFKPLHRHYVPVGSVEFVSAFLKHFYDLTPKPINVPEELFPFSFTQRYIFNGKENDLKGKQFVKSNDKIKGFCGILNKDEPYILPEGNYQYSDVISIDSEWRAFVYDGKLVGLQNYVGEFTKFPSVVKIKTMIDTYKSPPIAYTLDVGVNDDDTFIIECHDFFSCGLYGFADHAKYPSMLHKWFWEYIKKIINEYSKNNNMVSFLKENGFPATIHIETRDFEDVTNNFKGYHSVITDENGKQLAQFCHTDLRARIHWANGYFTALRNGIEHEMPLSIN